MGSASGGEGVLHTGGRGLPPGVGGSALGGWADHPHRILRDTVNKRMVHISLECILVSKMSAFIFIFYLKL